MYDANEQKLYDVLNLLGIQYVRYEHKPVYTIEEADQLDICIPGILSKNLFLRNRKGDEHYLVVVDETKRVDLKLLAEKIGSTPLSFASEERLHKYLGLKPGSVTPFGLINDVDRCVKVILDEELTTADSVSFHPNVNTATINVSCRDFERFIKWCGNEFRYVSIDETGE